MENKNQIDKEFSLDISNIEGGMNNKIIWFSFIIFILALVAVAVFIFKYYENYSLTQGDTDINQEQQELDDDINFKKILPLDMKGNIFLTLASIGDENNTIGIYNYNLKKERFGETLVISGKQFIGGEVFHTGNRILTTDGEDIFINDMTDLDKQGIVFDDNVYNLKNEPVWSTGGWYTFYTAFNDLTLDLNVPENHKIYSVYNDGTQKYLADGVHPHVSKDNYVVFLKNDGLYAMDLDGKNQIKIWEIAGDARTSIQFDISKESDLAVLTNPFQGSVFILKAKIGAGENLFEGEFIKEIKTYGFHPTFSFDDRYLALIELEENENKDLINPKLVVYNLENYDKYILLDLKYYKQQQIRITDWWF